MPRFPPVFCLLLSLLWASSAAADRFALDHEHTRILFRVDHLGFSDMIGDARAYQGSFSFDPAHPEASSVEITIDPAGIVTSSPALDKKLQDEKFFDRARYPAICFASTATVVTGANTADIEGDLTLLGVTKPLVLKAVFHRAGYHPLTNDYVAGFSVSAQFNRSDFGMNALLPHVGDTVRFEIEAEGIDQDKGPHHAGVKELRGVKTGNP